MLSALAGFGQSTRLDNTHNTLTSTPFQWSPRRLSMGMPNLRFGKNTQTDGTDTPILGQQWGSMALVIFNYHDATGRDISTPDYQRYLTEVFEGPSVYQRALDNSRGLPQLTAGDQVVFVGEGSSKYCAEIMAPYFRRLGIHVRAMSPNQVARELSTRQPQVDSLPQPHYVFLSQSGGTESLVNLTKNDALKNVAVITNTPDSPLHQKYPDSTVLLDAGEEQSIPATKSVLATLGALSAWARDLGYPAQEFQSNAQYLVDLVNENAQATLAHWADAMCQGSAHANLIILGDEGDEAVLKEMWLKLRETSGAAIESSSLEHFHHGPKSIMKQRPNLLVVLPHDFETAKTSIDLLGELMAEHRAIDKRYGDTVPEQVYVMTRDVPALTAKLDELGISPDHQLPLKSAPSELGWQLGTLKAVHIFAAYMTDQNGLPINSPYLDKSVQHNATKPEQQQ